MMDLAYDLPIDWTKADLTACRYQANQPDWFRIRYADGDLHCTIIGEDTDGDGVVDFIHADTTGNGRMDFSAFFRDGRWHKTNLVEAWLEVNFALPYPRDNYIPHNVELRFNGVVIATFRDALPEGHYAFPIPPRAIQFPADAAKNDTIEVASEHLRGGHYMVTSDFQVLYRLSEVDAFVIADSRTSAEQKILNTPGFRFQGGDLAVNSNDIVLSKTQNIVPGERITVRATIFNWGMDPMRDVVVAMIQSLPGGSGPREISRVTLDEVGVYGPATATFFWTAVPGQHTLSVVIDPDNTIQDNSRFNNKALVTVSVPGKDIPPQLEIVSPAPGQKVSDPAVLIDAKGTDESGILLMEYRLDDGIWIQRQGVDRLHEPVIVPPGEHVIYVRATDCGGNTVGDSRSIIAEFAPPSFVVVEPGDHTVTDGTSVTVVLEFEDPAAITSIRASIGGGAGHEIAPTGQKRVSAVLPLEYGKQILAISVTFKNGLESVLTRNIESTSQVR